MTRVWLLNRARHLGASPRAALGTCACLALCLLVAPEAARAQADAQPTPPAAASSEARDSAQRQREHAAKTAFQAGVEAAEAGDYARARELFVRSRELVVKASTLLNLAVVDLKLGLAEDALDALDALDASGPEPGRLRERALELRKEAESLRQRAAIETSLSDEPPPVHPEAVAVSSMAAAAPLPPPAVPAPASLTAPRALLITGGVLSAAAIGGALWWSDRSRAVDACLNDAASVCLERDQIEREQRTAMALTLTLGVAGVGLLTGGAVWLAQRKHDRRTRTYVSAWILKHSAGAVLNASF